MSVIIIEMFEERSTMNFSSTVNDQLSALGAYSKAFGWVIVQTGRLIGSRWLLKK